MKCWPESRDGSSLKAMKINRATATTFGAIGTAAVVSVATTVLLVSGGSHPAPTVNAHFSSSSTAPSPSASPSASASPTAKPAKTAAAAPAQTVQSVSTAPRSAPIRHAAAVATDTPTTAAPAPAPVPQPPPYTGPRIGGSCSTPGETGVDSATGIGSQPVTCGTDNQWYRSSDIYPGKPCSTPNVTTSNGYTCKDGTWQRS